MSRFIDILPLGLVLLLLYRARPVRPLSSFNNTYLDIVPCRSVRGFMALFVILHHLSQQTEQGALLQIFRLFGNLPVSVFFFLSGYGIMKKQMSCKDSYLQLIRIKIPQLLAALCFALCICGVILNQTSAVIVGPAYILHHILNGHAILVIFWYMFVIPMLYLVFAVSAALFPQQPQKLLLPVGIATLLFILCGNFFSLGQWWYNTCHLFLIGLAWAAYEKEISCFIKKHYWPSLLFFGLLFLFVWQYFDSLYALWPAQEMRLMISLVRNASFATAFVLLGLKLHLGNPILDTLGRVSLELYLLHPIFLLLFRGELFYIGDDILFCLAVLSATVISALLLNKPYCFLCRKYEELINI